VDGIDLCADVNTVTKRVVQAAKAKGLEFLVWTWAAGKPGNDVPDAWSSLQELGVDAFTSDCPPSLDAWMLLAVEDNGGDDGSGGDNDGGDEDQGDGGDGQGQRQLGLDASPSAPTATTSASVAAGLKRSGARSGGAVRRSGKGLSVVPVAYFGSYATLNTLFTDDEQEQELYFTPPSSPTSPPVPAQSTSPVAAALRKRGLSAVPVAYFGSYATLNTLFTDDEQEQEPSSPTTAAAAASAVAASRLKRSGLSAVPVAYFGSYTTMHALFTDVLADAANTAAPHTAAAAAATHGCGSGGGVAAGDGGGRGDNEVGAASSLSSAELKSSQRLSTATTEVTADTCSEEDDWGLGMGDEDEDDGDDFD
jgi:hypothetical protein